MKNAILSYIMILLIHQTANGQLTGDTLTGLRLSSFTAGKQNTVVRLNWRVACQLSYAQFEVQRSVNGTDYTTIHSFQADYLRCQQPFDYTDPAAAGQVFYRIKVGDIDGRFSTEKIVRVSAREISETTIKIISPVSGNHLQLTVEAINNDPVTIQVLNAAGVVLQKNNIYPLKGINQIELPVNHLAGGIYLVQYQSGQQSKSLQFIKHK